jgi:hypothetical protein
VLSWVVAGLFVLIAGGASCQVTGRCTSDGIAFIFVLALLPAQALIAAYLRQRSLD